MAGSRSLQRSLYHHMLGILDVRGVRARARPRGVGPRFPTEPPRARAVHLCARQKRDAASLARAIHPRRRSVGVGDRVRGFGRDSGPTFWRKTVLFGSMRRLLLRGPHGPLHDLLPSAADCAGGMRERRMGLPAGGERCPRWKGGGGRASRRLFPWDGAIRLAAGGPHEGWSARQACLNCRRSGYQ